MPRQLPWLNHGSGSQKKKPKARTNTLNSDNDGFFDGTVLASPRKGTEKAVGRRDSSDNDLPDLPAEPSTPSVKRVKRGDNRAVSSSPPPVQDLVRPQIDFMRTGTRYDLRDDEWMMVEDEFLETAKLFTRHLHIAEYEKLKERIEAKKKAQVKDVRPVVKGAAMSAESKMKEKARVQATKQRNAIRDVFASQNSDDEADDRLTTPAARGRSMIKSSNKSGATPQSRGSAVPDSDSDNLDIPNGSMECSSRCAKTSIISPMTSVSKPTQAQLEKSPPFVKPALPQRESKPRTTTSRRSRATPFDMLDDYVPPTNRTKPSSTTLPDVVPKVQFAIGSTPPSVWPVDPITIHKEVNRRRSASLDDPDDWKTNGRGSSGSSKETADRLAKRKAERKNNMVKKEKDKAVKLEEIPTFLF